MTGTPTLRVRTAGAIDTPRIAALALELGYEVSEAALQDRIVRLLPTEHALAVAVRPKEGVVGWVEVRLEETLLAGRRCRVTGLIVDARFRRQGAGRLLLHWAERWARTHGCEEMYLTSNVKREGTHAFYDRMGWEFRKSSHVYTRRPRASR